MSTPITGATDQYVLAEHHAVLRAESIALLGTMSAADLIGRLAVPSSAT